METGVFEIEVLKKEIYKIALPILSTYQDAIEAAEEEEPDFVHLLSQEIVARPDIDLHLYPVESMQVFLRKEDVLDLILKDPENDMRVTCRDPLDPDFEARLSEKEVIEYFQGGGGHAELTSQESIELGFGIGIYTQYDYYLFLKTDTEKVKAFQSQLELRENATGTLVWQKPKDNTN